VKLRLLTPAKEEFGNTIGYYREIDLRIAKRFVVDVDQVIDRILANPERFRTREKNFRYAKLRRFSYHIVYWIGQGEVVVAAFAHTSMQPLYWLDRVAPE
jgi:plasmid stabilization system protein ParE